MAYQCIVYSTEYTVYFATHTAGLQEAAPPSPFPVNLLPSEPFLCWRSAVWQVHLRVEAAYVHPGRIQSLGKITCYILLQFSENLSEILSGCFFCFGICTSWFFADERSQLLVC